MTSKEPRPRNPFRLLGPLVIAGLIFSACPDSKDGKDDAPQALEYRLYLDGAESLESTYFRGLVSMPESDGWFLSESGEQEVEEDQDPAGNLVAGPAIVDGHLVSRVRGSGGGVNLIGVSPDGTISSSIDVDSDGIVDLFDIRLASGIRGTIANELGRDFLRPWLEGRNNPFCQLWQELETEAPFGCDEEDEGEGEEGGGSATGGAVGLDDPFASICAIFRDQSPLQRQGGPVFSHGGHGYASVLRVSGMNGSWRTADNEFESRAFIVGIQYRFDDAGNHVSTTRETRYFNKDGDLTRTIRERVDHEGSGTRTVTDHHGDGTTTSRSRGFRTTVDGDGKYETAPPWTDPDAPEATREDAEAHRDSMTEEEWERVNRSWPAGTGATSPDPGPEPGLDNAADWEAWCLATEEGRNPSGLEIVTAVDHGLFDDEICVSAESNSTLTGNCVELSGSRPWDIATVLEPPSAGSNCGPLEEPGPDGTCGPVSGVQRFLGRTALLGAIRVDEIEICDPKVCQPGFFGDL